MYYYHYTFRSQSVWWDFGMNAIVKLAKLKMLLGYKRSTLKTRRQGDRWGGGGPEVQRVLGAVSIFSLSLSFNFSY